MDRKTLWPVDTKALKLKRAQRRDSALARIRALKNYWRQGFLATFPEVCDPTALGIFDAVNNRKSVDEPIIQRLELYAAHLEDEAATNAKLELELQTPS